MNKLVLYLVVAVIVVALTVPGGLELKINITGETILQSVGIGAILVIAIVAAARAEGKKNDN